MPKSKRARLVHETQVAKKSRKERTKAIFQNVQAAVDKYEHLFIFSLDNERNTYLKEVRTEFSDSRIFFGKTKVMALALGTTRETAYATNLEKLKPHMTGAVGLLFTSRDPRTVTDFCDAFHPTDFARAGDVAPRDFTIPPGVVYSAAGELAAAAGGEEEPLSHTMEPQLRKLNVPTRLVRGKVTLEMDGGFPVCRNGDTLNSNQTALLKMFGVRVAEFRVRLKAHWTKESGEIETYVKPEKEEDVEMEA